MAHSDAAANPWGYAELATGYTIPCVLAILKKCVATPLEPCPAPSAVWWPCPREREEKPFAAMPHPAAGRHASSAEKGKAGQTVECAGLSRPRRARRPEARRAPRESPSRWRRRPAEPSAFH